MLATPPKAVPADYRWPTSDECVAIIAKRSAELRLGLPEESDQIGLAVRSVSAEINENARARFNVSVAFIAIEFGAFCNPKPSEWAGLTAEDPFAFTNLGEDAIQISAGVQPVRNTVQKKTSHIWLLKQVKEPAFISQCSRRVQSRRRTASARQALPSQSARTTTPPFITNRTRSSSVTSASGSPDTAIRSAGMPTANRPA